MAKCERVAKSLGVGLRQAVLMDSLQLPNRNVSNIHGA